MGTEAPDMLEDNEYPNVRTSAGTSASELNDLLDDDPPVLGAGCGLPPMPTEKEAWMAKYVIHMVVEHGIDAEDAWACCRSGEYDHDYSSDPRDAAEDEMSYWDDDGDLA